MGTRSLLITATLLACWLGMMIVHEAGHVLAALLSGGTVTEVVLHPLSISRTDVIPNPRPLLVAWAGPLLGAVLPIIVWGIAAHRKWGVTYLLRFFAGFCCVANGAYIGCGVFYAVGDVRQMRAEGTPAWVLGLFALVLVPLGLALWHRQGRNFGVGRAAPPVNNEHAWGMLSLALLIVLIECWSPGK